MDYPHHKIIVFLFAVLVFGGSCTKEMESLQVPDLQHPEARVFLVCEGSYGSGNASLGLYKPESDSVFEQVFQAINEHTLGDVFQSMIKVRNRYFLSINNSDRITVLDSQLVWIADITVPKPRYFLKVDEKKVYVSSLYQNKVYILNPESLTIDGTIDLPARNPEGMLLVDGRAFICCWDTTNNQVYIVNTATDQLADSITVAGYAPQEVLLDHQDNIWVLSGNSTEGTPAAWTQVDLKTGKQRAHFYFDQSADVLHPVFNPPGDTLYYISVNYSGGTGNNGVFRMATHNAQLPAEPFIPAGRFQYFWGLGIDERTGDIYIGDPKGFIQKSEVFIYRPDGTLMRTFSCGAGIGHFYFD